MHDGDDIHFDTAGMQPANGNNEQINLTLLDLVFDVLRLAPELGYTERDLHDAVGAFERRYPSADIDLAIRAARSSGYVVLRSNGRLYVERRVTPRQMRFVRGLIAGFAQAMR